MALNQRNANRKNSRPAEPAAPESYDFNAGTTAHYRPLNTSILTRGEDPDEYCRHCQMFFDRFAGRDEVERQLIQELASLQWRLNRIPRLEAEVFATGQFSKISALSQYEHRLAVNFEQVLSSLLALQGVPARA